MTRSRVFLLGTLLALIHVPAGMAQMPSTLVAARKALPPFMLHEHQQKFGKNWEKLEVSQFLVRCELQLDVVSMDIQNPSAQFRTTRKELATQLLDIALPRLDKEMKDGKLDEKSKISGTKILAALRYMDAERKLIGPNLWEPGGGEITPGRSIASQPNPTWVKEIFRKAGDPGSPGRELQILRDRTG